MQYTPFELYSFLRVKRELSEGGAVFRGLFDWFSNLWPPCVGSHRSYIAERQPPPYSILAFKKMQSLVLSLFHYIAPSAHLLSFNHTPGWQGRWLLSIIYESTSSRRASVRVWYSEWFPISCSVTPLELTKKTQILKYCEKVLQFFGTSLNRKPLNSADFLCRA